MHRFEIRVSLEKDVLGMAALRQLAGWVVGYATALSKSNLQVLKCYLAGTNMFPSLYQYVYHC